MSSGDAGSGLLPAGIQAASVQHPAPAAAHRKASSAPTRTGRVLLPRRSLLPARHRRHRAPDLMLGDPVGNGLQSLRQHIGEGLTLCRAQRPVRHGMAKPLIDLERGLPGRGGELMDRPQQGLYVGRIAQRPPPVPRGSTLNPDFRPFSESAFSAGAGLKAMIAKVLWWHVCNSHLQT